MRNDATSVLKSLDPTRWVSVAIGFYGCVQSFYFQGVYTGHERAARELANICFPVVGSMCVSGGDPYSTLISLHVYLNWLWIAFLVASLFEPNLPLRILRLVDTAAILYVSSLMRETKLQFISDTSHYTDLIRSTSTAEWSWIIAALLLLTIQLGSGFVSIHARRSP